MGFRWWNQFVHGILMDIMPSEVVFLNMFDVDSGY